MSKISSFPHEAVHTMLSHTGVDGQRAWLNEGLASHIGGVMFNHYAAIRTMEFYEESCKNRKTIPIEIADFKLYRKLKGSNYRSEELDMDMFNKAYVYNIKMNKAFADCFKVSDSLEKQYNYVKINENTADWSYPECEQFVAWLIENYSLRAVLEVNFEYDRFDEIFGKSLDKLHEEWDKVFLKSMEELVQGLI